MSGASAPRVARVTEARRVFAGNVRDRAVATVLVLGLAAAVATRFAVLHSPAPRGLDGAIFGVLLLALATATAGPARGAPGVRNVDRAWRAACSAAAGLAGGFALVAIPLIVRWVLPASGPATVAPAVDVGFLPWTLLTLLVAGAEEALLRGACFKVGLARLGPGLTVAATSAAFALMHVPFYGWGVVPLDFAAGVFLGGLRLATGGVLAPTLAHAVADLATWWL
jgi:membrane protease YdiL (CAAX protease family)